MDPQVSGSFIPKKPLAQGGGGKSTMGIVVLSTLLIFIASLLAAGAVFAYTQFLKSSIAFKKDSLAKAQSAYDPAIIEDLIRLDSRIAESKRILGSHLAPSGVFTFLSLQTLERVQFGSFNLAIDPVEGATLTLEGEADNFSTIALQSDQFGGSKVLKDVVFSDLVIAETGKVTFTVTSKVDEELLLYSKNLVTSPPSEQATAPTEGTVPPAGAPPAVIPPGEEAGTEPETAI